MLTQFSLTMQKRRKNTFFFLRILCLCQVPRQFCSKAFCLVYKQSISLYGNSLGKFQFIPVLGQLLHVRCLSTSSHFQRCPNWNDKLYGHIKYEGFHLVVLKNRRQHKALTLKMVIILSWEKNQSYKRELINL